jgi:hypothetical protein
MGKPESCDTTREAAWLRPHGTEPEAPPRAAERFAHPMNSCAAGHAVARTAGAPHTPPGPFVTRPSRSVRVSFTVGAEPRELTQPHPPPCDAEADLRTLLAQAVRQYRQSGGEALAEFDIDGMRVVLEESFLGGFANAARRSD